MSHQTGEYVHDFFFPSTLLLIKYLTDNTHKQLLLRIIFDPCAHIVRAYELIIKKNRVSRK